MNRVLDLDENLLSQVTKITGEKNLNALIQMLLSEFVTTHKSEFSPSNFSVESGNKLSDKLLSKRVSKDNYETLKAELKEMRSE